MSPGMGDMAVRGFWHMWGCAAIPVAAVCEYQREKSLLGRPAAICATYWLNQLHMRPILHLSSPTLPRNSIPWDLLLDIWLLHGFQNMDEKKEKIARGKPPHATYLWCWRPRVSAKSNFNLLPDSFNLHESHGSTFLGFAHLLRNIRLQTAHSTW